jgi:hypothetical protein
MTVSRMQETKNIKKKKLRGLKLKCPQANYTGRVTAACQRS